MKRQLTLSWSPRINYASGLSVSALMLAWPNGRPSYVALETFAGLDVPWWVWPVLLIVTALNLLVARGRIWLAVGYLLVAILIFTVANAVLLSVGPAVQLGFSSIAVLGAVRQAINAKSELA
ncbi:hypothetical protein DKM44_02380 [Deinococcus irradiatisoli]|uniref:Uncharacterized protein n=1 Tax=Deinococcus irradiatisoli TaxID=2202254 RepID=A0A2Z3JLU9_9DEIO|nr:hypothetical protein [Deinococcus irradiatisoli]AWN22224.1 hypothetical protein DKM44_02380 [Deinococcus irradiatisoli]